MMADPVLQADASVIVKHLTHITRRWPELGQPCALELVFLNDEDRAVVKNVARFTPDESGIAAAADHAAKMNAYKLNAYAVVNPVDASRPLRAGKRAEGADILASFFHFADADDQQAADNIRNFVGPKCTFSVTTGTVPCVRPHVYWELEEPTRNLQAWSETQTRIKNVLATDSVTDPPRIMRLAGTINWPKPKKIAKGYKPELTTLNIFDPDVRPPVSSERLYRAFSGGASQTPGEPFDIDTGPQPMDRLAAINNALTDKNWNSEVFRLVGSYVRKGLADDEIHAITDHLTLPGYTIQKTREEVQDMIVRTRDNPEFAPEQQRREAFDHAPNAAPEDTWRVQSAADFTADFVAPEYIVDGVIQRGRLYTLTAPTGSGKTAVMLYLATQIATGGQFCGKEVEQGDVLFLAGENPDDVRARVIATMEFYGIDPAACRLHFIPGTFSIRADMERLRQEAAKLPNLMLVVVDTFAAYFDGEDENSNAQALDFARVVRTLTMFPSKPAVSMPAHPVKNATKGNLTPKGGSSLLNEVDGNLTLWKEGAAITLHWQGKFRGAEFDALTLELERYESDSLKDSKGRLIPTILAKPVLTLRAQQIARENLDIEDRMLLCVADSPEMPLQQRAQTCGLTYKTQAKRVLEKLMRQKLVKPFRSNWELTKDGERAVEIITSGGGFAADLDA